MKKLFMISALLVSIMFTAKAQTTEFNPNWFFGLNGGVNEFVGEGNKYWLAGDDGVFDIIPSMGYLGRFEAGYNFTKVFALRGMVGYNQYNWYKRYSQPYNNSFNSETLTLDAMFNMCNLRSFNPDRKLNFYLFGGLGGAYLNNNTSDHSSLAALGRAGAELGYNITRNWMISLIGDGNIATDNYNNTVSGFKFDGFVDLTLGLTYKLPNVKTVAPAKEVVEEVMEEKPDTTPAPVVEEKPDTTPAPVVEEKPVVKEIAPLMETLYYGGDQYALTNEGSNKLKGVADYVKANDGIVVVVSGYADKETGGKKYNQELSQKRADTVTAALVKLGVPADQIVTKAYGDKVQLSSDYKLNRAVVIVNQK